MSMSIGIVFNGLPDQLINLVSDNEDQRRAMKQKKGGQELNADKVHKMLRERDGGIR